jgi:hypothetical protein
MLVLLFIYLVGTALYLFSCARDLDTRRFAALLDLESLVDAASRRQPTIQP